MRVYVYASLCLALCSGQFMCCLMFMSVYALPYIYVSLRIAMSPPSPSNSVSGCHLTHYAYVQQLTVLGESVRYDRRVYNSLSSSAYKMTPQAIGLRKH